jgi:integral membrane protein
MNSAMMSMARTVAKEKGHDPRVIEAMIDMDRELIVNGQVLCAKGEILTLDAEEATMLSDGKPLFAKAIASTLDDVKTAENLKGATVTAEPLGFERVAILITKYASILILLGIAMPLKYLADMPLAVRLVGSLHGFLFLTLCACLLEVLVRKRLSVGWCVIVSVCALFPFAPFFLDRKLKAKATAAA